MKTEHSISNKTNLYLWLGRTSLLCSLISGGFAFCGFGVLTKWIFDLALGEPTPFPIHLAWYVYGSGVSFGMFVLGMYLVKEPQYQKERTKKYSDARTNKPHLVYQSQDYQYQPVPQSGERSSGSPKISQRPLKELGSHLPNKFG
jgi:hypothetical protein